MGLSTDLFLSKKIDDNLLCAICHDVLEDASSMKCGHTFCQGCIKPIRGNSCPTCRKINAKKTVTPNIVLRGLIGNLEVRCVSAGNNNSSSAEPELMGEPTAKRPRVAGDTTGQEQSSQQVTGCVWTGKISDKKTHEDKECQFHCIACDVPGCGFACTRKDMEKHKLQAMSTHLNLMVDAKLSTLKEEFDKKVSSMEDDIEETVSAVKQIQTEVSTLKKAMKEEHEVMNDQIVNLYLKMR
jgi:hypothetical protein